MTISGKWLYWSLTLPFGLTALAGLAEILFPQHGVQTLTSLGYPDYLIYVLGIAKLLGGLTIVFGNRMPILKDWAYAGYTIEFSGALISHVVRGGIQSIIILLFCLALTVSSHAVWRRDRGSPLQSVSI